MQVLGSLFKLPQESNSLPLPWWHRAPLGLLNDTPVYVALIKPENRPVPDIIVTVLDPSKWHRMIRVSGTQKDEPGVIAQAVDAIFPHNIAISETVTIETGSKHHMNFVGEPFGDQDVKIGDIRQKLKKHKLGSLNVSKFIDPVPAVLIFKVSIVQHGWIHEIGWREVISEAFGDGASQVDLDKAVVSADTNRRLLRYVFPLKGTSSVSIEHADVPGALRSLFEILSKCNLNVLSYILRRGGLSKSGSIKPYTTSLIAVCETKEFLEYDQLKKFLEDTLKRELQEDRIDLRAKWRISEGDDAERVIYCHHPDEIVARVPNELQPLVEYYFRKLPKAKFPIFISRRFVAGDRRDRIVNRVRKVLNEHGYHPMEAHPEAGQFSTSLHQVGAQMWVARAGIVLVAAGSADEYSAFSENLAHEAGFLQGQGKPVLCLVEHGSSGDLAGWSNAAGLVCPRFAEDETAFDPDCPQSIDAQLLAWLNTLNQMRRPAF